MYPVVRSRVYTVMFVALVSVVLAVGVATLVNLQANMVTSSVSMPVSATKQAAWDDFQESVALSPDSDLDSEFVALTGREPIPLYRFYSPVFKKHFYTASESEKDKLINNDPNWEYESIAYYVREKTNCYSSGYTSWGATFESARASTVFRFYSPVYKAHFYTNSGEERKKLEENDPNWIFEGAAFCAENLPTYFDPQRTYLSPELAADGSQLVITPVYRFYSPVFKAHFFTTSESEKQKLIDTDPNWNYERIEFYGAVKHDPTIVTIQ